MKKVIILFSFVLMVTIHQSFFDETSIFRAAELLASSRSKEFCSCFFIVQDTEDRCLKKVLKGFPLFDYKIGSKSIEFSNPLYSSLSKLSKNPKLGRVLVK